MAEVGSHLLLIALGLCAWGVILALVGIASGSAAAQRSAERAVLALAALLSFALLLLARLFLADDFSVRYVAEHSSRTTPALYKLTAVWGGQAGSLLLWVWMQSIYAAAVILVNRARNRPLMPVVTAVLATIAGFFLSALCFAANPFLRVVPVPPDGVGLNPLLQNAMMAIHPPMLYTGLVGFSVPFAFAIAALASGQLGDGWLRTTRRWTLFTWFALGTGILLGSWWAYLELGWGGYWGWDAVENASLLPWLIGSAFLHSVMIQEQRRMLRIWNVVLVTTAFALCILGTFITRSGVISSVHSFAQSGVGWYFLFFLFAILFGSAALILHRLPQLRATHRIESLVSRESGFLFNNVLFVGLAFAVLWGTLFPILSEWVRGSRITVSRVWFETFAVPLGLALLLLTGLGPLLAWKRSPLGPLGRRFRIPVALAALVAAALAAAGVRAPLATAALAFCAFVASCTLLEFAHGTRLRMRGHDEAAFPAFVRVIDANKRRYGGFVVHMGMVLIFAGITASSAWQVEATSTLARGESFSIGPYRLTFSELNFARDARAETHTATIGVERDGRAAGELHPAREIFPSFRNQPATEVDILHTLSEDLYVVLIRATEDGRATLKAYVNPLVSWIWIGGGVLLLGGLVTLLPDGRPRRAALASAAGVGRAAA